MNRSQQPQIGEPRLREHDTRIRDGVRRDAVCRFLPVPGDARRLIVYPDHTLSSGVDLLSMPFRPYLGDDPSPQHYTETGSFTLDLDNTGLSDTAGTIGGRIDGVSLAASTDYLIWGFLSSNVGGSIEGIGITTRPAATGITMPAGAALGSTSQTVTVGTNLGNRFAVGARVRFYDGLTAGSNWNQAIVTATAANTITVDFDASLGLTTNNNTTMASLTGVTCIQLDNVQPRVGGETTSYNSDQPYCYLGSIQTDGSSNIRDYRKRGEFLILAAGIATPVNRTGITASESFQVCMGNWLPLGASRVSLFASATITAGTPGNALVLAAPESGLTTLPQRAGISSVTQYADGTLQLRRRDCSYFHQYTETGTLTVSHSAVLIGHYEENW